jgi:hypothetical protein
MPARIRTFVTETSGSVTASREEFTDIEDGKALVGDAGSPSGVAFVTPAAGEGGGVVDQGAAGAEAWPVTIPTPVPVTDNAGSLTVDGSVSVSNFPAVQAVSDNGGSLTVDGTVGISGTVPVSGPATDAQLRATPLPVSGTVGVSGTVPVSGPLTDGQLRGSAVPVSLASVPSHAVTDGGGSLTVDGTFWQATQPVSIAATVPVSFAPAATLFTGRASTFRTPGRAGTAGQKILSLHNATGSAVTVKVKKVVVDFACTVVKAITVLPPVIRLWKVTVLPTNGTALSKVKIGGSTTSSASVTVLGDASADGTSSASALTATLPAGQILTQEYAPRFVTAAGYEPADRIEFQAATEDITLGALEGVVLFLDYTVATANPLSDQWLASIEWTEQ